jgi:hypothetical protein
MIGVALAGSMVACASMPLPTSEASPRPTPSPVAIQTTVPGSHATTGCKTADISVDVESPGFGAGNIGAWLRFTNTGGVDCDVQGFPTLSGIASDGTATQARHSNAVMTFPTLTEAPLVVLEPGDSAFAAFVGSDKPPAGAPSCPPAFKTLSVAPPGETETLSVSAWNDWLGAYQPSCRGLLVTRLVSAAAVDR